MFNGHYHAYCYLPLHLYEGQSGKLITTLLRPGCRPTGAQIVSILKRVVLGFVASGPRFRFCFEAMVILAHLRCISGAKRRSRRSSIF